MRTMLKSKIHRATVTQADLHYVGSVTDRRGPARRRRPAARRAGRDRRRHQRRPPGDLRDPRRAGQRRHRHQRRGRAPRAPRRPGDPDQLRRHGRDRGQELHPHASCTSTAPTASSSSAATRRRRPRACSARCAATPSPGQRRSAQPCCSPSTSATARPSSPPSTASTRIGCWRVTTAPRATADELRMLWRGLLRDTEITGVAACSTVPALLPALRAAAGLPRGAGRPHRPGRAHRRPAARRQPARGRRRPGGHRAGRARAVRPRARRRAAGRSSSSTSAPPPTSTPSAPTGSSSAARSRPGVEVSLDALATRAAQLRSVELTVPAAGHRQEHRRRAAVGAGARLRRPGRRAGRPDRRRARGPVRVGAGRRRHRRAGARWSSTAAGRSASGSPT